MGRSRRLCLRASRLFDRGRLDAADDALSLSAARWLVAMRGRPRAPDPADHGGIDERSNRGKQLRRGALAPASDLGLKIVRDRLKQVAVETVREKLAPEALPRRCARAS